MWTHQVYQNIQVWSRLLFIHSVTLVNVVIWVVGNVIRELRKNVSVLLVSWKLLSCRYFKYCAVQSKSPVYVTVFFRLLSTFSTWSLSSALFSRVGQIGILTKLVLWQIIIYRISSCNYTMRGTDSQVVMLDLICSFWSAFLAWKWRL